MSLIQTPPPMTTAEFLALPDDGVERWLIDGRLRERSVPVRERFRDRIRAEVTVTIGKLLGNWRDSLPHPRGKVLGGDVGVVLAKNPDSVIGVDIVYVDAESFARQSSESKWLEAVPVLAVVIPAPRDTFGEIAEKVDWLRSAGVQLVWKVDARQQFVNVYRPDRQPQLFGMGQVIDGGPHLPGLSVMVSRIFA